MSKGKLIAALTVVAVVVVGAATYGYATISGGDRADSYQKDFAAWNSENNTTLAKATTVPVGMFPVTGVESYQDKKLLAAMAKTCEQTNDQIEQVAAAVKAQPTLSATNPLSRLNGDWKDAAQKSDERVKIVKAYTDGLTDLLERRAADCRFNVQYDQPNPTSVKAQKQIDAHDVDAGKTVPNGTGTYSCGTDQNGCIPVDPADLKPFLAAHQVFVKTLSARGVKVGNTTWTKSSYEPAAAQIKAYFTASSTSKDSDVDAMRTFASDLDNDKLISDRDKRNKTVGAAYAKIFPVLAKAYPDLSKNAKVKADPLFSEQFLGAIDAIEVEKLAAERKAFTELD